MVIVSTSVSDYCNVGWWVTREFFLLKGETCRWQEIERLCMWDQVK